MSLQDLLDGSPPRSQDLFTNRVAEADAFRDALGLVRDAALQRDLLDDLQAARLNVLNFYGMGGVGKSELSKHLQSRLHRAEADAGSADPRLDPPLLDVRLNMSTPGMRDNEVIVLALRSRVAAGGVAAPAFDLAFSRYWTLAHPGTPMRGYLSSSSNTAQIREVVDLGSVIQDAVDDLLDQLLDAGSFGAVGLGFRAARSLVGALQARSRRLGALADCPHLDQALLSDDAEDLLWMLPYFLAWDLHQVQLAGEGSTGVATLVVFVDAWEDVQAGGAFRGALEDRFSAAVSLMPNALFVICGRERLRWADAGAEGALRRSGARLWPGLAAGSDAPVRQHRVGPLSAEDSRLFLQKAVPGADERTIAAVVTASQGHPEYLDCAVAVWHAHRKAGAEPHAGAFPPGFPQMLSRLLRGLTPMEQELLQVAAVCPAFDAALLSHLVPRATRDEIAQLLQRTLVEEREGAWLPFRIAQTARRVLSDSLAVRWSSDVVGSVRDAAIRWVAHRAVADKSTGVDRRRLLAEALDIATELAADDPQPSETLLPLITAAMSAGVRPTAIAEGSRGLPAAVSRAMMSVENHGESDAELRERIALAPSTWLTDLGRVALARRALLRSDLDAAAELSGEITSSIPVLRDRKTKLDTLVAMRRGSFRTSRARLEAWSTKARNTSAFADLAGHIDLWNGSFDWARSWFAEAAHQARRVDDSLALARALRHEARAASLAGAPDADDLIAAALDANEGLGSAIGVAQCEASRGLLHARAGDADEGWRLLESSESRLTAVGAVNDVASTRLLGLMCGVILRDLPEMHRRYGALRTDYAGDAGVALTIAAMLLGRTSPLPPHVEFDDVPATRSAWRSAAGLGSGAPTR